MTDGRRARIIDSIDSPHSHPFCSTASKRLWSRARRFSILMSQTTTYLLEQGFQIQYSLYIPITMASVGWFATLTNPQLKDLLAAASLPVSGSKAAKMERLLKSPCTSGYDNVQAVPDETSIQEKDRYDTVLRLLQKKNPRAVLESIDSNATATTTAPPPTKKARLVQVLQDDALDKRKQHRLKKLNKQINDRLKWKPSFKYGGNRGKVAGCRVDVDCPEPEVFHAMFGQGVQGGSNTIKTNNKTGKMTRTFASEDDLNDCQIYGKSYRFGAQASLQVPASATLHEGKLVLSFKYTVSC
jgi:hypothetical protein